MDVKLIHEPNDWCVGYHCFIHNVDEDYSWLKGKHRIGCWECGHLYVTGWHLKWHYSKALWQMLIHNPNKFLMYSRWDEFHNTLEHFLRSFFRRAKTISFCQHCIHDF